jgi:hypothetical protein
MPPQIGIESRFHQQEKHTKDARRRQEQCHRDTLRPNEIGGVATMAKRHQTLAAGGAAGLILLAVSLLAVFGTATPAQAQIDISGNWDFEVHGFAPDVAGLIERLPVL